MKHIACIGLGNPGPQFNKTRHNIGFLIVDALAKRLNISLSSHQNYLIASALIENTKISLIKPQTFMNNSGDIIHSLIKKGINKESIIVVHDELELAFGVIKFKQAGSAKGHNGLRSIMQYIGPDFERLRFGIGRPINKSDVGDYVLEQFTQTEQNQLNSLIEHAVDQIMRRLLS